MSAEGGYVEDNCVGPSVHQGVRGHFERGHSHTTVDHLPQQPMQVGSFRGGSRQRHYIAGDVRTDSPDDSGGPTRRSNDGLDHVSYRRLPVGPRNADHREPGRRVSMNRRCQLPHPAPGVIDHELGALSIDLVIDDDESLVEMMRMGLEADGMSVVSACDGAEGIEVARAGGS